jgi:putative ABC transport system ATP-binding protein
MSEPLVACEHASRTFGRNRGAVVALHDITCSVDRSTRVALVGPSGSGKSTLLHLMAGLDHCTSGTVTWPVWDGGPFGEPSRAGLVFQEAGLIPALSALENAAFPLLAQDVPAEEALARAREAMELLGVASVAAQTPDELSGGQAQRVAVARVVAAGPALILADEPTGKVDPRMTRHVVDVLLSASEHLNAGLVVTTHDPRVARRLDEMWTIYDGELVRR